MKMLFRCFRDSVNADLILWSYKFKTVIKPIHGAPAFPTNFEQALAHFSRISCFFSLLCFYLDSLFLTKLTKNSVAPRKVDWDIFRSLRVVRNQLNLILINAQKMCYWWNIEE